MWRVTGKSSYLNAGLWRIVDLYTKITAIILQGMQENRLPVINKGRGVLSFDELCELCELHNLWLKQFPMTIYLDSLIAKSTHLSLVRRCADELWGKGKGSSRVHHQDRMTR